MFGVIGDILGGLAGNMFAEEQQTDQQNFNEDQSAQTRAFNAHEAELSRNFNSAQAVAQRDWAMNMSNTQYQRATLDMKNAGLNPMLAYHQGGAGVPSGMSASGAAASATPGSSGISSSPGQRHSVQAGMQSASQVEVNQAIADKTRAEEREINQRVEAEVHPATAGELRGRTQHHAVSIDNMRQQIKESIERIDKIRQETLHTIYSAQHIYQQTQNLRALLPQIAATVRNLDAMTKQHGAMTGKTEAETQELQQKIKQNLPELNAKLMKIEELAKQTDMPRRLQDERLHDSAVGSLAAILRALVPFMK